MSLRHSLCLLHHQPCEELLQPSSWINIFTDWFPVTFICLMVSNVWGFLIPLYRPRDVKTNKYDEISRSDISIYARSLWCNFMWFISSLEAWSFCMSRFLEMTLVRELRLDVTWMSCWSRTLCYMWTRIVWSETQLRQKHMHECRPCKTKMCFVLPCMNGCNWLNVGLNTEIHWWIC